MRVHDALRVAGRAARVAHRGRGAFVDLGIGERAALRREQVVVVQDVRVARFQRRGVGVAHDDVALDAGEVGRQLRQHRHECAVDDHDAVLGVVHDVGELFGEEPDVERVQHATDAGDREVRLEVLLRVPREGRDAVTRLDAETAQGGGQPIDPARDLGERRAARGITLEGRDLAVAEDRAPVPEDRADREREVLHGGFHETASSDPCDVGGA
jgi:hypothetical protein